MEECLGELFIEIFLIMFLSLVKFRLTTQYSNLLSTYISLRLNLEVIIFMDFNLSINN